MKVAHIVVGASLLGLAGCANLGTVNRSSHLAQDGVAVHLDAPQRVVVSTVRDNKSIVCAEPSPDALQAYASSFGVGFAAPTKESVSLAQQLAVSSGSIGLRTQSITLMRDALYRICELYLNGAISDAAAVQLLQRSQDLSLGILAIEQLTGAVVAQQVNLTTGSTASSTATSRDMTKALERAQANEERKKETLDAAEAALEAQKAVVGQKKTLEALTKKEAEASLAAIAKSEKAIAAQQDVINAAIKSRIDANVLIANMGTTLPDLQKDEPALAKSAEALKKAAEKATANHAAAVAATPKNDAEINRLKELMEKAKAEDKLESEKLAALRGQIAKAEGDLKAARTAVAKAATDIANAKVAIEAATAEITKTKEEPVQVAYDAAAAALKAANADLKKKQDAADVAQADFEQAQADVDQVVESGSTAASTANATGSGKAAFSTSTSRYGVNKHTADALSKATTEIVKAVLYKPHLTDSCVVMLMGHANDADVYKRIAAICSEIIAATLEVYRRPPVPGASASELSQPAIPAAPAPAIR